MKTIEKAKITLRKHLLKNKEQVRLDLKRMRKSSTGFDALIHLKSI
jgi:hypothetical protein